MRSEKDDIEKYKEGSLTEAERHALEKRALHDPFLADALEGVDHVTQEELAVDLDELAKKIGQPARSWFTPLRIAAGVVVFIGAGFLFYLLRLSEPVTIAEDKSITEAREGPVAPMLHDSSSLLTLAKPEDEKDEKSKQAAPQPIRREVLKTDQNIASSETKTGSGLTGEKQKSDTSLMIAEEAEKIAEIRSDEIVDAKKGVVNEPVRSVPLSQGDVNVSRKESRSMKALSKDDDSSLAVKNISGKVLFAEDGTPLPGVNVVIKGTSRGTVTDSQGNFSIGVDDPNQVLVFSFIGMKSAEINPGSRSTLQVQLLEDVSSLSEVVVGANRLNSNTGNEGPVIKNAAPVGGLSAYNKYLDNNLRYPQQALEAKIKGRVIVSFTVTPSGSLSEFNILKGLGHGCDDEVIRLVKEGPRWTPATEDNVAVESEVKVRMKFDPEKAKK